MENSKIIIHKRVPRLLLLLTFLFLAACANINRLEMNQTYGEPDFGRYETPVLVTQGVEDTSIDWSDVESLVEQRCVVCHGCYDSPCQLKLDSYEGLTRGASKVKVYNATRLFAAAPSRLFVDADRIAQWRRKGFFPVLNERSPELDGDVERSVIHRILALKQDGEFPLTNQPLPDYAYDFSLNRDQSCPLIEEMASFEVDHPQWGMPYGLPKLADAEYARLTQWIAAGAPSQSNETLDNENQNYLEQWEEFLNQESLKAQLMSRYIYEHWFLAHLYFDDVIAKGKKKIFFELVRSSTGPGEPIQLINTRRPYDDPGVSRVYYRLRTVQESIVAKTHMPYVLNDSKMVNIREWFLTKDYQVEALPSYEPRIASNPFLAFADIPSESRYRLLLEEARFTIMGFIKGPVCRGQVALNVINDHFWVVFTSPDNPSPVSNSATVAEALSNIRFPSENGSTSGLLSWRTYADSQMDYLTAKSAYANAVFNVENPPSLDLLWDGGDGQNKNAALTIFRHSDSASVEFGLVGENPQTMWVVEYPLLEKIHYLLVAGFDIYGNYGHQLTTRLYMDFLRMEGEFNFLALLPKNIRNELLQRWYRGADDDTKKYFESASLGYQVETGIPFSTNQPYLELQTKLRQKMRNILDDTFSVKSLELSVTTLASLDSLANISGRTLELMPPLAMIALTGNDGVVHRFTLIHNNAAENVAHLLSESSRRLPNEDTLTLVRGFIGAYPNTYFKVPENNLKQFVDEVSSLNTDEDYSSLLNQFGIRRTHPDFWEYSDKTLQAFQSWNPIEYGLLDYNRFENR